MTYDYLSLQRSIFHSMRGQILPGFFLHHGFVIGPVADVHFGNRIAFEDDDVCADAVEGPIV